MCGYMYTRYVCMGTCKQGLSVWVHVHKVCLYEYIYTRSVCVGTCTQGLFVWVHVNKVCLYGYMYTRSVCMGTCTQGLSVWIHVNKVCLYGYMYKRSATQKNKLLFKFIFYFKMYFLMQNVLLSFCYFFLLLSFHLPTYGSCNRTGTRTQCTQILRVHY